VEKQKSRSSGSEPAALARAWDIAVRLLATRDRSEQEVRARLAAGGIAATRIEQTVRRLRRLHYLDEARFAIAAAQRARDRGYGSARVRAELTSRGVAAALIEDIVAATFAQEHDLARHVLAARFPNVSETAAERAKAGRFLLRRGFPEEVVFSLLGDAD
jgi:regulatory protein